MSSSLSQLSHLLYKHEMIEPKSLAHIEPVCVNLRKLGRVKSWEYTIEPTTPIYFIPIKGKKLPQIAPRIYFDVAVKPPKTDNQPPFSRLVTVIEVWDVVNKELQSRWHIDLANRLEQNIYQAGPLFHLQGGGHQPQSDRTKDLKISLPRFPTPPIELILTCELIIANFYPVQWETLKKQRGWLELIQIAQRLCYAVYFQRVQNSLAAQQSLLNALWAQEWGKLF
jgi:hypothetical protein